MGQILHAHCEKCGFNTELFLGGGRRDCEIEVILSALPEKKRQMLEVLIGAGAKYISLDRKLAVCGGCGMPFALPVVTYTQNGQQQEVHGLCPCCGSGESTVCSEKDALSCPSCDADLTLQTSGHWD